MKHATLLAVILTAACGGSDGENPDRLYLALLDSELTVRLSPVEPNPF